MRKIMVVPAWMLIFFSPMTWAVDSYRFLHVTADTPWSILPMVLSPLLLMAALYWYFSFKKKPESSVRAEEELPKTTEI